MRGGEGFTAALESLTIVPGEWQRAFPTLFGNRGFIRFPELQCVRAFQLCSQPGELRQGVIGRIIPKYAVGCKRTSFHLIERVMSQDSHGQTTMH